MEVRAQMRSSEYEASQLKNLEPKVKNLKKILAEWDQELIESLQKEAFVEEKVVSNDSLTAQVGEQSWNVSDL